MTQPAPAHDSPTLPAEGPVVEYGVVSAVGEGVRYAVRMAVKAEALLDEVTGLLRDVRPLVPLVVEAVEDGLLDEVRATLDRLDTIPRMQADVTVAVETLQTLVGLASVTLDQLEAIPGAGLLRRRFTKALADAQGARVVLSG